MQIKNVRIIPLTLPIHSTIEYAQGKIRFFQRIILEIITDDGIVGYGECRGDALRYTAFNSISQMLIGQDPYHLERLRWIIAPQGLVDLFQGSIAAHIYSAVEMACLDIIGKSTGRSVSDLLGGRLRDDIEIAGYLYYTSGSESKTHISSPDSLVESTEALVAEYGFTTLKYKCGVKPPDEEVITMQRLRQKFPEAKLRLDPNGAWGISTSVKVLSAAREVGLEFLEDPVPAFPKMARIHAMNLGTPLASNQSVASLETIALNEAYSAVDIPLLDVNWYGGLRAAVVAGRMAELMGLDVGIHSSMEAAVSQAAQLHLAACIPNLVYASDTHYIYLNDDIRQEGKFTIQAGKMAVPAGPGLGIEIDQAKLNYYHQLWQSTGFVNWCADSKYPIMLPRW